MDEYLIVGRVSGVFGTRGWLRIQSFTRPLENLLGYDPWYLRTGPDWTAHHLREARRHHGGLIAALEGLQDRDQAAAFVRADIAIERGQLKPVDDDEYYWADLIGMSVNTVDGEPLGNVSGLYDAPAHDILRVKDDTGRERLIPFVRDVHVIDIDRAGRLIRVDWHPDD